MSLEGEERGQSRVTARLKQVQHDANVTYSFLAPVGGIRAANFSDQTPAFVVNGDGRRTEERITSGKVRERESGDRSDIKKGASDLPSQFIRGTEEENDARGRQPKHKGSSMGTRLTV